MLARVGCAEGDPVAPDLAVIIDQMWGKTPTSVVPLSGGITNRNFRVDLGDGSYVVRLPGENTELLGIDRRAERAAAQAAAAAGVGPAVVGYVSGALITRFVPGEPIGEQRLVDPAILPLVVAAIRRFHGVGSIPGWFSAFLVVEDYREVAASKGVDIPPSYDALRHRAGEIEVAFAANPMPDTPCHNDLLNANFIAAGDRVFIVDYEYAGMGDPFFDLANFTVNNLLDEAGQERVLELYFGELTPTRLARLKLMRIMSDFREAMWGVVQRGISRLDFDYLGYADKHFTRGLGLAADDRYRRWLVDASGKV